MRFRRPCSGARPLGALVTQGSLRIALGCIPSPSGRAYVTSAVKSRLPLYGHGGPCPYGRRVVDAPR